MSEYKHTVARTQQTGFAESPEQQTGNSQNPLLDSPLTASNAIVIGVGIRAGKQVFNSAYTATVGQIGNSRLDEAVMITGKLITYGGIIIGGGPVGIGVAAAAAAVEIATISIKTAVNNHAINLDNNRIRSARGTLINFNAGGYYG